MADSDRPNIIVILSDQLRRDALGVYGDPNVATPNIDRLARKGVRFTNACSTFPVCVPFRFTLMTGEYAHSRFVPEIEWRMSPAQRTLADEVHDVTTASKGDLKSLRRQMGMIFQDPFSSLDPRMTVQDIVGEPLRLHGAGNRSQRMDRVRELIVRVGLEPEHLVRFPHAFSGGQRQRICIARALSLRPSFVMADEPVSALDVSVQAQVLDLLQELQEEMGLAYLFISHDLSVVRHIADRVAVMYFGRLVELAESDELFANPLHPYTRALLSAVPVPDPNEPMNRIDLGIEPPDPTDPPCGCILFTDCPHDRGEPAPAAELREVQPGHFVRCHDVEDVAASHL